jgi:hypothetical protein
MRGRVLYWQLTILQTRPLPFFLSCILRDILNAGLIAWQFLPKTLQNYMYTSFSGIRMIKALPSLSRKMPRRDAICTVGAAHKKARPTIANRFLITPSLSYVPYLFIMAFSHSRSHLSRLLIGGSQRKSKEENARFVNPYYYLRFLNSQA